MGPAPNLLPQSLLRKRSRRRRVRQWMTVLLLEALLGLLAGTLSRYDYANPAIEARRVIDSTVSQIDLVASALSNTQGELQRVQQRLAVASEVAEQPDWSIVLGAIAWRGQGLVELTSAQLMAPTPVPGGEGGLLHRVSLLGTGENRPEVTRFVERLEQSGIFSQIRISQTQTIKNPLPNDKDHERVGFTIEAWLADGGPS